ncbi:TspO/MBR family protein [Gloeocapsopsis dulcis]|uniref:TspO protein n=1 Tax=Gloeocapsopsis dulcis AAB1 = 1H9 TaxID=1433147 RepID=A0A6N8FT84_9CHRO|nr:tryptophan-rich sensory protein [Gloeocapsopsis dulcis]MUL35397.1 TspO protein [Gloeocapsopsis dulcis AAB1 = 1H9]WNN90405.1 tryptophan-rich sensory protein [Gloeocapsopsis dulcis]
MLKPWMVIGGITLLIALATLFLRPRDTQWAKNLKRPKWLVFEPLIPVIWTIVFTGGALSAATIWERDPGSLPTWLLMGLYLLLEIITVTYIPATLRSHNLKVGTILGGSGVILGIILILLVWNISGVAALLLLPYLLWSPVGTYTTWEMMQLNPEAV